MDKNQTFSASNKDGPKQSNRKTAKQQGQNKEQGAWSWIQTHVFTCCTSQAKIVKDQDQDCYEATGFSGSQVQEEILVPKIQKGEEQERGVVNSGVIYDLTMDYLDNKEEMKRKVENEKLQKDEEGGAIYNVTMAFLTMERKVEKEVIVAGTSQQGELMEENEKITKDDAQDGNKYLKMEQQKELRADVISESDVIVEEKEVLPKQVKVEECVTRMLEFELEEENKMVEIERPSDVIAEEREILPEEVEVEKWGTRNTEFEVEEEIERPPDDIVEEKVVLPVEVEVELWDTRNTEFEVEEEIEGPPDDVVEEKEVLPVEVEVEECVTRKIEFEVEGEIERPIDEDFDEKSRETVQNITKEMGFGVEKDIEIGDDKNIIVRLLDELVENVEREIEMKDVEVEQSIVDPEC